MKYIQIRGYWKNSNYLFSGYSAISLLLNIYILARHLRYIIQLKKRQVALSHMAQLVKSVLPQTRRSWVQCQGTYPGCGFEPQFRVPTKTQPIDVFHFNVPLSFSFPLSLKAMKNCSLMEGGKEGGKERKEGRKKQTIMPWPGSSIG